MLQMGRLMKPQLRCRNLDLTRKVFQSNVLLLHFSKLHCEIERAPSALGFGGWMNRVTGVLRVCCLLELWDWLSTDTVWWGRWVVILALLCISDFHSCEPLSRSFFFSFFFSSCIVEARSILSHLCCSSNFHCTTRQMYASYASTFYDDEAKK